MSYVLILMVWAGSAGSVSQHEYRTEAACESAGQAAKAEFGKGTTIVKYTCQSTYPK